MTKEMNDFLSKLITVQVRSVKGAFAYVVKELELLDYNGKLSFVMNQEATLQTKKELKVLKKYYKGKLNIKVESIYQKYQTDTPEYFILFAIVQLMKVNGYT